MHLWVLLNLQSWSIYIWGEIYLESKFSQLQQRNQVNRGDLSMIPTALGLMTL